MHSITDRSRLVRRVQRMLRLEFYRNLKIVRGTPFQPLSIQQQLVLSGPEFEREADALSKSLKVTRARVQKLAIKEFKSIAANPVRPLYWFAARTCRFIIRKVFGEITTFGLERFVSVAKRHTVMLVPMHRSHFDYLLVGQQLYDANISPPLVAAGINLSFWPSGPILRSLGAYFVKRGARTDRIHSVVLRRYVTYLVRQGHLQEFFIEGGRSRSGRMRPPRVGLLLTVVEAFLKGLRKEIVFVPVAITYESVVEDRSFADENTGRKKQRENFFELLKARSIFRNRYGDIMLCFGEPISLVSEISKRYGNTALQPADTAALTQELGTLLTKKIRLQTGVSLTALAYTALLTSPRYGLCRSDLIESVRNLAAIARYAQRLEPEAGRSTPTLQSFLDGNEDLLDDLLRRGVVQREYALQEQVFLIPGTQRFTADFYKNSLFHLFFPVAVLSALQCLHDTFSLDDAVPLHGILEADLLLEPWQEFKSELLRWCELLCGDGILEHAEQNRFRFVKRPLGMFCPIMLMASIEGILWSYKIISGLRAAGGAAVDSVAVPYASVIEHAQTEFRAAQYLDVTSRTEASSQSSLKSALEVLEHCGIIAVGFDGKKSAPIKEVTLLKRDPAEITFLEGLKIAISLGRARA